MTPEVVQASSPKIANSNKNAYVERSFCSNSLEAVCVVKILSKISGCEVKTTKLDGEPKGLQQLLTAELTVTSQSPFDETKRVMTVYKGLYACLYQLCVLGNLQELGLLGSSPEELSRMEEWVDRCVMSSSSTSSGQELMQLVEQTLSNSSGGGTGSITYLIGSTATVADVCVSVFLYRHFMAENPNHHVVLQPWMDQLLLRHHHFLDSLQPLQRGEQQHQPQPSSPGLSSVDGYLALTPEECSANDILAALSHASIPYVAYTHTKCNTAEELVSNVPLPSSDHVHTKNLLFKDKKHGLFLVTTKANASSSASDITKSLSKLVQGKSNFRLASADTLKDTLGVEPGCVGPLCLYKDTSSAITFVLDETLVSNNYSYIHSHPLINTISCMLRPQDLLQFITQVTKHEPIVLSLLIDATSASSSIKERNGHGPINYSLVKHHDSDHDLQLYFGNRPTTIMNQSKFSRDRTKKYQYRSCRCGCDYRVLVIFDVAGLQDIESRETEIPDDHDHLSHTPHRRQMDKEVSALIIELLEQNQFTKKYGPKRIISDLQRRNISEERIPSRIQIQNKIHYYRKNISNFNKEISNFQDEADQDTTILN
jgi:hypothetical protein